MRNVENVRLAVIRQGFMDGLAILQELDDLVVSGVCRPALRSGAELTLDHVRSRTRLDEKLHHRQSTPFRGRVASFDALKGR